MTIYLRYRLELTRPAVIGVPGGDPNSAASLEYIPGSAVRGAVAAAVASDVTLIERLVLGHDVRYLNAYWAVDGVRSLPTPAHWHIEARRGPLPRTGSDLAATSGAAAQNGVAGARMETVALSRRGPYWVPVDDKILVGRPQRMGRIHTSRPTQLGGPDNESGQVFSYEALAANQSFVGLVAIDDPDVAPVLRSALAGEDDQPATIRLGRSQLASYGGRARLTWLDEIDAEVDSPHWSIPNDGGQAVVVLLSDAIVRHPSTGQVDPLALPLVLADRGLPVLSSWHRSGDTGGFNRTWGLALPQQLAVAAGSAFLVQVGGPSAAATAAELESAGIGLRRRDGFGRVRLASIADNESIRVRAIDPPTPASVGGPLPALVDDLGRRRLRRALHQHLSHRAASIIDRSAALPTNSLLGRLRTVLRSEEGLAALGHAVASGTIRGPARAQLNRCHLTLGSERVTLLDALRSLTKGDRAAFHQEADMDALAARFHIAGQVVELSEADIDAAAHHLVDELLRALHNQQRAASRSAARAGSDVADLGTEAR